MAMGSPYSYERVLADNVKYPKITSDGKFSAWWESYFLDEGFESVYCYFDGLHALGQYGGGVAGMLGMDLECGYEHKHPAARGDSSTATMCPRFRWGRGEIVNKAWAFYALLRFFFILRRLRFPTNEGKTVPGLQFHCKHEG
jgi:hypothetical protein